MSGLIVQERMIQEGMKRLSGMNDQGNLILTLYRAHIKKQLVDDAVSYLRAHLTEVAEDMVSALEPQIRAQMNHLEQELVVQFSVREPKA